jgi:hAT family C-terminal dimerisation region
LALKLLEGAELGHGLGLANQVLNWSWPKLGLVTCPWCHKCQLWPFLYPLNTCATVQVAMLHHVRLKSCNRLQIGCASYLLPVHNYIFIPAATAKQYRHLHPLFQRVFCTPASSAPVERIFSQSGIIMRPHRAKMNDALLETLVFLKCNSGC